MLVDHHFTIFFPFKSIQQRAPYKKEGVALGLPFPLGGFEDDFIGRL